jgi:hypothetical protein
MENGFVLLLVSCKVLSTSWGAVAPLHEETMVSMTAIDGFNYMCEAPRGGRVKCTLTARDSWTPIGTKTFLATKGPSGKVVLTSTEMDADLAIDTKNGFVMASLRGGGGGGLNATLCGGIYASKDEINSGRLPSVPKLKLPAGGS